MKRIGCTLFLVLLLTPPVEACRTVADLRALLRFKTKPANHRCNTIKLGAFHKLQAFPLKTQTLTEAFHYFEDTPGFIETVKSFVNHGNEKAAEGHWYEIEKAVSLHQQHCTDEACPVIVAFNQKVTAEKTTKEFDIFAFFKNKLHLYECKNVNWEGDILRTQLQLIAQQKIAQQLAKIHQMPLSYLLSSKQPVPEKISTWLNEQHIPVELD